MKKTVFTSIILVFTIQIMAQNAGLEMRIQNVIVQNGTYLIVNGETYIRDHATLDISGYVTIGESLENDEDVENLKVRSTDSYDGSLIFNGGEPRATVERYTTHGEWHLTGPCTSDVRGSDFYFNNNPMVWVLEFLEPNGSMGDWEYVTDLNADLERGEGWNVWIDDNKTNVTIDFEGRLDPSSLILNQGSHPPLQFSDYDHGYNLISNPFSSSIDWLSGNWELTEVEETIWVWDESSGNYAFKTKAGGGEMPNGILQHGQGFFIKATDSSPQIIIPSDSKVHNSQTIYKNTIENNYGTSLKISAYSNNKNDHCWISFSESATEAFDNGFDASKKLGSEDAPQLYLMQNNEMRSINYLPALLEEEERSIPLFYKAGTNGEQIIEFQMQDMFGMQVILEDLVNGDQQVLETNDAYIFTSSVSDSPERFLLHFYFYGSVEVDEIALTEDNIQIYSNEKEIIITNNPELNNERGQIKLYDITGRIILNKEITLSGLLRIPTILNQKLIITEYQRSDQTIIKKLWIQ